MESERSLTATRSPNFLTRWISSIIWRFRTLYFRFAALAFGGGCETVVLQQNIIRQLHAQDFARPAHNRIQVIAIQQLRVQPVNLNGGVPDAQRVLVGLPFQTQSGR